MATFDKSRPYGQVFGLHAASYEQDGRLFDAAGHEIKPEKPQAAEATEPAERPAAEPVKRRGGKQAQ